MQPHEGPEPLSVYIRWMIRRDMPEVLTIERQGFEFPWTEEDFVRCLRQRNCIGMVAEHDERVVGYMVYELCKNRLQLLNIAVRGEFRRRGVGTAMVWKLQTKLSAQRRRVLTLEVGERNLPAQLFFRAVGFQATGVLKGWYEHEDGDAYAMRLECVAEVRGALE